MPKSAKKLILIAEDDKYFVDIFNRILPKEGYNIQVAEDGQLALDAIHKQMPDLLILDLVMPIKNGFDVLAELKKENILKDLKVVVLSNLNQDVDVQKAKEYGAIDYLVKANISVNEVLTKIKSYFA